MQRLCFVFALGFAILFANSAKADPPSRSGDRKSEFMKKFDKDGDGKLSDKEKAALRAEISKRRPDGDRKGPPFKKPVDKNAKPSPEKKGPPPKKPGDKDGKPAFGKRPEGGKPGFASRPGFDPEKMEAMREKFMKEGGKDGFDPEKFKAMMKERFGDKGPGFKGPPPKKPGDKDGKPAFGKRPEGGKPGFASRPGFDPEKMEAMREKFMKEGGKDGFDPEKFKAMMKERFGDKGPGFKGPPPKKPGDKDGKPAFGKRPEGGKPGFASRPGFDPEKMKAMMKERFGDKGFGGRGFGDKGPGPKGPQGRKPGDKNDRPNFSRGPGGPGFHGMRHGSGFDPEKMREMMKKHFAQRGSDSKGPASRWSSNNRPSFGHHGSWNRSSWGRGPWGHGSWGRSSSGRGSWGRGSGGFGHSRGSWGHHASRGHGHWGKHHGSRSHSFKRPTEESESKSDSRKSTKKKDRNSKESKGKRDSDRSKKKRSNKKKSKK